jgi:molybdate transport system permease protein
MSGAEVQILGVSFGIALRALLWALPFAVALAYVLSRRSFRGKTLLDAAAHLPLVLPPVLIGYFLLLALGRRGPIGHWLDTSFGVHLAFTANGAALATAVMIFPLLVRAIRLAMEAVDPRIELAARTLGASRTRVFFTVTLPLSVSGIATGGLLSFARALGEFGATITFVSNIPGETQTISAAIYTYTQIPNGDAAAAHLVIVAIVISLIALIASEWLARRAGTRLHGGG